MLPSLGLIDGIETVTQPSRSALIEQLLQGAESVFSAEMGDRALQSLLLWRVTWLWFQRVYWTWTCWKCCGRQKGTFLMLALIPGRPWCCFFPCQAPHRASSQCRDFFCLMQTALPVKPSPLPPWFFLKLCTSKSFAKGFQEDVSNTYEYPCPWVQAELFAFVCPPSPLDFILTQTQAQPQPRSSDSSHSRTLSRILIASREQGWDVF